MQLYINSEKKSKRLNKGFTLIEVIVIIAILAILASVVIPQYLNYVESANETADLAVASSILETATLAMITPGIDLPPNHYVEVLWTAGADSQAKNYEGILLVRQPMRSSAFTKNSDLKKLTNDAMIKEYAEYLIGLFGKEAVPARTFYSSLTTGYAAYLALPKSQLANEAALAFHINTSTGEIVLATWAGNGDVNKWVDIGLPIDKSE